MDLFDLPIHHKGTQSDSCYVLSGFNKRINTEEETWLKEKITKLSIEFSGVPWGKLRESWPQLSSQVPNMIKSLEDENLTTNDSQGNDKPKIITSNNVPVIHNQKIITIFDPSFSSGVSGCANLNEYHSMLQDVSNSLKTDNKGIYSSTLQDIKKTSENLEKAENEAACFYAMLLPNYDTLKRQCEVGMFQIMLGHILNFLKNLVTYIKTGSLKAGKSLWDIILEPDKYYLHLRGVMHEFERENKGYQFLEYLMILPDLVRLYIRLLLDKGLGLSPKVQLGLALLYTVVPLDILPEGILGPVGYIEDIMFVIHSLLGLIRQGDIGEQKLAEHWNGTNSQETLTHIVKVAEKLSELDFFNNLKEWWKNDVILSTIS